MTKILIVEDEVDLKEVLSYNLRQIGWTVIATSEGKEALRLARTELPQLVLLDLMLPDLPGTEVCRQLKADPLTRQIPVVMLTALSDEVDRVVGFELGADDYVGKPFSVRELLLRLQAILRRTASSSSAAAEAASPSSSFGCLRIDRAAHRVLVEDREVRLTPLEFKLLCALFDHRDRVLSRSQLLDDVWNIEAAITTRTVDTHVKRLREKIGKAGDYIETVRGVGYRFGGEAAK